MIAVISPVQLGFVCFILLYRQRGPLFFDRQLGVSDDLAPSGSICLDVFSELLRRAGHRLVEVRGEEFFSKISVNENALDVSVDLCNDVPRRSTRCEQAEPKRSSKARKGLSNGRQFGELDE